MRSSIRVAYKPLYALILTTALSVSLAGCGMSSLSDKSSGKLVTGEVFGGQQAITGSTVQLYQVGIASDGSAATPLITTTTVTTSDGTGNASNSNANAGNDYNALPAGAFTIGGGAFTCPTASSPVTATQVYIVATGGNPGLTSGTNNTAIAMMAALGPCSGITSSTHIHLNELTTIGSLAPIAAYMNSISTLGSGTSDAAQFLAALNEVADYTDTSIGAVPGPSLPSGYYASSVEIQTLGDVISACINSTGGTAGQNNSCGQLFTLATPPSGTAPTDVIGAVLTILKYPSQNVCPIFNRLPTQVPFQPTLSACPTNWELPILPIAATPVISPGTGSYTGAQFVSITDTTANSSIYYTTNGTTPTSASTPYTGSFEVNSSSTVQAVAVASGYATSAVASSTYTLGAAGAPAQLAFLVQPANTAINTAIAPSVQVAIEDASGHIVSTASNSVTLALSPNPGSATLSGTATATAVNGIATFSNLSLNVVGTGYGFLASSSGLTTASSATFNITLPTLTVTLPNTLVGIGSTLPGTFTLGQAAPSGGLTVNLASNATSDVTISPATVTVAQGATSGSFTYTGVAVGTASLSASATGYVTGSASVTGTETYISLGTLPTIAPSQTSSLALSLGQNAGTNGVTVTFTSTNTAVATVTPSVFIPSGFKVGAENPQITGTGYGTTTITASAPGYAPDIRTVTVSLTTSLTQSISVPTNSPQTMTLTLSAGAPTGGLTFTLMSSNTSYATVPATLTIPAGSASGTFTVTGVSAGSSTISASYPGLTTATSSVTVYAPAVNVTAYSGSNYSNVSVTGVGLYIDDYITLGSTPPSAVTLTLSSSNPSVAILSTNSAVMGAGTVTVSNFSGGYQHFQIQGLSAGTSTLTISAPGYTSYTTTVTVDATGLVLGNGTFSTTSFSGTTSVSVVAVLLNSATLAYFGSCDGNHYGCVLNPNNSASIAVTSSNAAVGTISSSPVTIAAGSYSTTTSFQPVGAGTSTIALGTQPSGFSATTSSGYLSGTATVTAPTPTFGYSAATTIGVGLMNPIYGSSLGGTAPSPVTATVTSSNPSAVLLSTSPTALGSATLTFTNLTNGIPNYYVQGVAQGTSTITVSAPGVTTASETVTVNPSGVVVYNGISINTTSFSGTSNLTLEGAILNSNLTFHSYCGNGAYCLVGPSPLSIAVTSSNTAVGTITSSPVTIAAGGASVNTSFTPLSTGTTTIALGTQPTGLSATTSSGYVSGTATVTAPTPAFTGYTVNGVGLYEVASGSLGGTAPSPVTVTVTSSNPSVVLLSTNASTVGSASISFTNITNGLPNFYVQGVAQGTSTLTISAPGVNNATETVTVYPVGIVFTYSSDTLNTTTFSSPSGVSVGLELLNTGTLTNMALCGGGGYNCMVGPGSASIAVTSSNTAVGTISTSPITIPAGSSSASTTFTPGTSGTTTIALGTQPSGFSASTSTNAVSGTTTVSAPQPYFTIYGGITYGNPTIYYGTYTGVGLYLENNINFSATAPSPVTATITSSNPAVAVLSSSASTLGSGTLTFSNLTSGTPNFYIQGLSVGSTVITVTIPGFNNTTETITVEPSGLVFNNSSEVLTTTTGSSPSTITVSAVLLNPGTLTYLATCSGATSQGGYACAVGPNAAGIPVTSSNTATGTITTSPVTLPVGSYSATTTFDPLAAGTSTLSLGTQPTGFTATSSSGTYLSGTATVSH
jgi:hypothetical protein